MKNPNLKPATEFDWGAGVSPAAASRVLADALRQGVIGLRPALMFHDLDMLALKIKHLQNCFPAQTLHALAIKANPMLELLRFAVTCGMGLEAASIEEVALARAAACPANRIVFDSPAKTRAEILQALAWNVTLNADNLQELERIDEILGSHGASNSLIGLRINPQIGPGGIGMLSVSDQYSKFGAPLDERREDIISAFARYTWLRALHVHTGSQGISAEQLVQAAARIFQLRDDIHNRLGKIRIESIDIGGGLPWRYNESDPVITPESYVELLAEAVPEALGDKVRLVTEFGRAIQAGCGFAASKVEYLKTEGGRRTAVIHFGADLFLRKVYRPNDWHHHMTVLTADARLKTGNEEPHTIVGPLCFGGDILADSISLPRIETGDWIILHDTGGYTLSLWSRHCNRGLPRVLGYGGYPEQFRLLFKGETPEDIVNFWS